MRQLDDALHRGGGLVRRGFRVATRAVNLAALGMIQVLDRAGFPPGRREPAAYRLNLDELYRTDGHWALTFARLGTIYLPPAKLRDLGAWLDPLSYLNTLARSRSSVGPATVPVLDVGDPAVVGRSIRLSDDYYGRNGSTDHEYYPYVMHPWVYALGKHRRVVSLRQTPRRFRLFFSGVVNDGYVGRFDFPIMSRPAIVEFVLDTFRADACVVMSRAELANLRRTDRPIALVVFRGEVTPMAFNHYLTRENYLRLLARSAFALCPPGVFMPHSHNLIEAMAVGTVPVTNYAEFCHPPLGDGQTCLAFSTPDELASTIRRALALPAPEIAALRAAVGRYYDEELSPEGAARRLKQWLAGPGPEYRLVLNREFPAARLWSRAQAQRLGAPEPITDHPRNGSSAANPLGSATRCSGCEHGN